MESATQVKDFVFLSALTCTQAYNIIEINGRDKIRIQTLEYVHEMVIKTIQ